MDQYVNISKRKDKILANTLVLIYTNVATCVSRKMKMNLLKSDIENLFLSIGLVRNVDKICKYYLLIALLVGSGHWSYDDIPIEMVNETMFFIYFIVFTIICDISGIR